MAGAQHESKRMHINLFRTIGGNLPTSSQGFKDFLTVTGGYLNPRDIALNKESAEDILRALESAGCISVGDYRQLKRILSDAGLGQLLRIVEEQERKIKEQLELENPTEKASNVPSEPGPSSSPKMAMPTPEQEQELQVAFTNLLAALEDDILDKDLEKLKSLMKGVPGYGGRVLQNITVSGFFEVLQRKGNLSAVNTDYLKSLLGRIHRQDLCQTVDKFRRDHQALIQATTAHEV